MLLLLACAVPKTPSEQVTWHGDIAPIVEEHCSSCHTPGNIAPFALDNYATASAMGQSMLAAVEAGTMPPWLAQESAECVPERPFANDLRLQEEEIDLLRQWVEAGSPEGDSAQAAPLPQAPSLAIENPDGTYLFPVEQWVEGEEDLFQCFVIDPGNTEKLCL